MTTNYTCAYIFTKHTDLLRWFHTNYSRMSENDYMSRSLGFDILQQRYAKPRDVRLVILVRYEGNKIFCKIKCPINPLPVKGEFEAASLNAIIKFLSNEEWKLKEKIAISLLR